LDELLERMGWLRGPDPELLPDILAHIYATGFGDLSRIGFVDRKVITERIYEA
jgi:hypothetical protein